jgi:chaperonin GroES
VQEGDRVLLPEYGGQKVSMQEKDAYLYRDDELLGIVQ